MELIEIRIGLIDVDVHNFPNLPLMKISAWHKGKGDSVEWYEPLFHGIGEPFDKVYMSMVPLHCWETLKTAAVCLSVPAILM